MNPVVLHQNWRHPCETHVQLNIYTMERCRCMWGGMRQDTYYSTSLCLLRGPGANDIPGASSTPSAQVLVSKFWNKVSSEKWLIPVLGQGKCKKSLEHLVVPPEGKEILTKTKGWSHGNQSERPPSDQSQNNLSNKRASYWFIVQTIDKISVSPRSLYK